MRIISLGIYLGIGAMLHALFIGPHFDWSSAWTFGWLLGWPIMIFIFGGVVMAGLVAIGLVVAGVIWLYELTWPWRQKRQIRKTMAAYKAKREARP